MRFLLPVAGNPADGLLDRPIEESRYDHATRCSKRSKPGVLAMTDSLARRMGVQELIWGCGYWSAGMSTFAPYRPCYTKRGKLRKKVNKTIAHRDHIHLGMTKPGAKAATSFWAA